ncbi:MAG: hypothetical protein KC582_03105 [Candidatus Magasanikbacteria bacterium]|nr:hypothetical protein [Candidatus Magasanikbacteria bacterium]MCA9389539.1 hypothetical protein [Candidatus Magasanikbacteria bacterium]MCA9391217.1 hypothetical protein [Candidatus Magasanikbacteria bacterium]USN52475.1 MAG: hypothetical protein H6759_00070 [Candidatus Nomurabacteria bacterium]
MLTAEQRIKAAWNRFQEKLISIKKNAIKNAVKNDQQETADELEQLRKKL